MKIIDENSYTAILCPYLFILFLYVFPYGIFSQTVNEFDTSKYIIGFNCGVSDFHVRDERAAPLTFGNYGLLLSGDLTINKGNYKHYFELTGYYSKLRSVYEEYKANNGRAGFRYNFLYRIPQNFSTRFTFYSGGGIYTFLNASQYNEFNRSEQIIMASVWYMTHNLELTAIVDYRHNNNNFSFGFSLPIVSNVSRPEYSNTLGTGTVSPFKIFGKMSTIFENLFIQFKTIYGYNLNKKSFFYFQYDFLYSSYPEPREVRFYMNNFRAGIKFLI